MSLETALQRTRVKNLKKLYCKELDRVKRYELSIEIDNLKYEIAKAEEKQRKGDEQPNKKIAHPLGCSAPIQRQQ